MVFCMTAQANTEYVIKSMDYFAKKKKKAHKQVNTTF